MLKHGKFCPNAIIALLFFTTPPFVIPVPFVIPAKAGNQKGFILKTYYVYILASKRNGTLYIGVTNDLIKRVYQHKNKLGSCFTSKYNIDTLVYYESADSIEDAIRREKQLKWWKRNWKLKLIEKDNKEWEDLYNRLI